MVQKPNFFLKKNDNCILKQKRIVFISLSAFETVRWTQFITIVLLWERLRSVERFFAFCPTLYTFISDYTDSIEV